jgi:hypothetical protein
MRKQIACLMALFVLGLASATIPTPHGFYGEVDYSDGTLIQESLTITAKISGTIVGNSNLVNGAYDLVVESENGGTIDFYVDGQSNSIGNYIFTGFAVTELNFTTSLANPNQATSSSSSSGSSSGGGGGGGRSSSSSSGTTVSTQTTDNSINLNTETENNGNINLISNENQKKTNPGITGAVIGFAKTPGGISLMIAVLIILAGIWVMTLRKEPPQNEE